MQTWPQLSDVRKWLLEETEHCFDKQTLISVINKHYSGYSGYISPVTQWEKMLCLGYIRKRNKEYREARRNDIWEKEVSAMDEKIAKEILFDIRDSILSVEDISNKEKQKTLLEIIKKGVIKRRKNPHFM